MNNVDLTLRSLFLVLQDTPKPKTFLFDLVFDDRETVDTEVVEVEFLNGRRFVAPFVNRYIGGELMPKDTFTGRTFKPYKIAPKKVFTADELAFERVAGENPYITSDPQTKKNKVVGKVLEEQVDQIARRYESMAAEVLYNLQLTVEGVGVKDEVHYYDTSKTEHHITATKTWEQSDSNPINDLKTVLRSITEQGGVRPNVIIMDPKASDLFQNNKNVKEVMNIRNFFMGEVRPEVEGVNGAMYIGTLPGLGVDIYEYQEYFDYIDPTTKEIVNKALIPDNTVLFAPRGNKVKYAAVSTIKNGIMEGTLIPKIDEDEKADTIEISTISKPVLIPVNSKSIKVLKVK